MKTTTIFGTTTFGILAACLLLFTFVACTQPVSPPGPPNTGTDTTGTQTTTTQTAPATIAALSATPTPDTFLKEKEVKIHAFANLDEYKAFLAKYPGNSYYSSYYGGRGGMMMEGAMMKVSADSATGSTPTAVPVASPTQNLDYSGTNNQVATVDEADMLKTDGNYIYTITENTLFIIKAYPGEEAKVVSTIAFKNQPDSLFIDGDHLAVFGNFYDLDYFKDKNIRPRSGMTFLNVYDISDREDPTLVEEYKFEGRYFNARMKDSTMYLVVINSPQWRTPYPTPLIMRGNEIKSMPVDDMYYFPIPYRNPELVTVHAVSLKDPSQIDSKAVTVEGGEVLYMSGDNIFLTSTEYINEWEIRQDIMMDLLKDEISDADAEVIAKINAADDEVLSPAEKQAKINQIYQDYYNYMGTKERTAFDDKLDTQVEDKLKEFPYFEYTVINKISVDKGKITVESTGKVPGRINNQFSLDEQNSVLRIATTLSQRWSSDAKEMQQSINNVYALNADMKIIGELEGLAKGEQIYSTRFMGDRLYMVTFRQVDPFFAIDLSDPTDITLLGQLKIPGFSRYLHPYDKNMIIGIGQDATSSGSTRGLKISLFDVSDVEHPKEVAKWVSDERYSQSTALYEHKAFLFNKEKNLLVIPIYSYDWNDWEGSGTKSKGYNGALVFHITADDIALRGLIDHAKGQGNYYGAMVERSLFIEELLYTKSPRLLRINDLDTLKSVKDIALTPEQATDIPVY
jgi:uncharacterized secreted protein with C-terminal beta-propeller domain